MKGNSKIDIFKIRVPIEGDVLTLIATGDLHYGVKGIEKEDILSDLKKDNKIKDIFRIFTGDMIENSLKSSVGHNYDIGIADPQAQKDEMIEILKDVSKDLYGSSFNKIKFDRNSDLTGCRQAGVIGNHEYRTRKLTGQWLDRELYSPARILSIGVQGILELTLVNKKLKTEKTYKIYVTHRLSQTTAVAEDSIFKSFKKKRSEIPGCDVYICGHYHNRIIRPDGYNDSYTGDYKKTLYVVNPSPMYNIEYAEIAGYGPMETGYSTHIYLPIDNRDIFGIV